MIRYISLVLSLAAYADPLEDFAIGVAYRNAFESPTAGLLCGYGWTF